MLTIQELDQHVTHDQQVADSTPGPVVLVNILHVHPDDADQLEATWGDILRRFKSSPGWISAQFHRGAAGSGTFLNYSVWESTAHYRAAFTDPEFRSMLPGYPDGTVATPHLFTRAAVEGVCVA